MQALLNAIEDASANSGKSKKPSMKPPRRINPHQAHGPPLEHYPGSEAVASANASKKWTGTALGQLIRRKGLRVYWVRTEKMWHPDWQGEVAVFVKRLSLGKGGLNQRRGIY
jgi:hypothetical protein